MRYRWLICLLVCSALASGSEERLKVLVYSGANNHNWQQTTPVIADILTACEPLDVSITDHPEGITAEQLKGVDVIVSNWNNFSQKELDWPASVRDAFIDFVQGGKGHVTIHAGGSSFSDWDTYHQIAASWGKDTGHGPRHTFTVQPNAEDHPITRGVSAFRIHDELWHRTQFPDKSTALMTAYSAPEKKGSGQQESVLTVNSFGKGRCVNLMLGHDVEAMSNPGFATLLQRSVTWAAGKEDRVQEDSTFRETEHSIAMCHKGQVIWQFNYAPGQTKPYFHPIALRDGTVLTWVAPPDHVWHYGLWFSWKFINGINYWEEDPVTGKAAGLTTWDQVNVKKHADGSADISLRLRYREPNQSAVLSEERIIEVSAIDETGRYSLDWQSEFTALIDRVELNRTPIPGEPDGKNWGGYAGLSFRAHKDIQAVQYTTDAKILSEARFRGRAHAVEYSGVRNAQSFGIAMIDHPNNYNSPTPWYLNDGAVMDYFSPAVLYDKPLVLRHGEKLVLRYRIIIHPGRWNPKKLNLEYQHFTNP